MPLPQVMQRGSALQGIRSAREKSSFKVLFMYVCMNEWEIEHEWGGQGGPCRVQSQVTGIMT